MSNLPPPDVPTLVRRGHAYARRGEYARAVEAFAARTQVQEELGHQIASFLESRLECRGPVSCLRPSTCA